MELDCDSSQKRITRKNMTAIPLCIPNNCSWDETSGVIQRDTSQPCTGLQLVHLALRKLRSIDGPVCVVSIVGIYKKGKSYILGKVFDQGEVFPLGHTIDAKTIGIWLWVVPKKYRDAQGREFTVVLLDSEGIRQRVEDVYDNAIFTLSVLLSSVLIYNSSSVPGKCDFDDIDYCMEISRRIQVMSEQPLDEEASQQVFPSFVWLLRDVAARLPEGVENLKAYFLKKMRGHAKEVVDKILKFFPDFDAFALRPPSVDHTVITNLNQKESQGKIDSLFKKGLKEFQQMLHSKLTPKRSFVGQGFVTGEALATLVEEYLRAGSLFEAIPVVESSQTKFRQRGQHSGSDLKGSRASNKGATPLCLPNNLKWDSTSGQYIQTEERRTSLYVLDEALEKLRRIQGPVCVISIAGLYRSGKSFVLSEAFSQPQVFRIGHRMIQETRGIWLWIVKEKFKDAKGQEFTVALLDSEGIYGEMDLDDNQICPLTLLLASVFIYNSQNVPRRQDLYELDLKVKLADRIARRCHTSECYHRAFPFFIWLARDVVSSLPDCCKNLKDYFLKVFKIQDSSSIDQENKKVTKDIQSFFTGFDAFMLPPPTYDCEVMSNMNDNKNRLNPEFLGGLEKLKFFLRGFLLPKRRFLDGELVTGEGLAALVQLFVRTINTPGVIPIDRRSWNQLLKAELPGATKDSIPAYIRARGPVAFSAYRRALETGKTYDRRTKVLLIGQDCVGKTSLGRYLRGETFNKDEPSTNGIEMIPPVKNAGTRAWRNPASLENTSALDHKCAEVVARKLLSSSTERSDSAQQFPNGEKEIREGGTSEKEIIQEPSSHAFLHETSRQKASESMKTYNPRYRRDISEVKVQRNGTQDVKIPMTVLSLIERGLEKNDTSDNEGIWPVVWDFAGQAVYHAIHPIFLSQEAIYVLVSDLTKELSAPAQCRIRPPNQDEIEVNSPYVEDTNLDHMMRWLDLVHSLGRPEFQRKSANTKDVLPPVVLVGTHADGVRDPCKKMEFVKGTIFSMAIPAILGHISKESFFIDNTNPNREDDPQIVSLRSELLNLAKKMPHIKKVIPMQWLRVEQKVDEMVKEKGVHYVGKKRFTKDISGGICQFNDADDVEELLHFLQARGRVIYQDRPENPDGLVVLDPQWLSKILCEIITVSPPWKNDPVVQKDYEVLGKKGLLSQQLLNRAFEHLELKDIRDSLIHIMESFDVICNSKNCKGKDYPYLVPCMLESPKKNTRGTNMRNGSLPVFLTFNTNYVPSGLFCRLVVHFWEWASQLCGSYIAPSLFSNAARFNVSKVYHLTLECPKTVIELKVWTPRDSDKMEEKRICEELLSHLERCRTMLSITCPWLRSATMELFVKCQLCEPCPDECRDGTNICLLHKEEGCSHFDCGHYIPLGSFGLSCEHSVDAVPYYPAEKLNPWVQALESIERKKRTGGFTKQLRRSKVKHRHHEESSPSDTLISKKGTTRFTVKQGVPSDEDLEWLSHQLDKWEEVGRRLKIEEATLTAFDDDNREKRKKIYKMLRHWKQKDGLAATYTVLHDALCNRFVNRTDLAEQLCCQQHE